MIRMRWRSSRLGTYLFSAMSLDKIPEQVMRIVRTWRRLGVILHAKDRLAAMAKSLQSLIVQIYVGHFDIGSDSTNPGPPRIRDCAM